MSLARSIGPASSILLLALSALLLAGCPANESSIDALDTTPIGNAGGSSGSTSDGSPSADPDVVGPPAPGAPPTPSVPAEPDSDDGSAVAGASADEAATAPQFPGCSEPLSLDEWRGEIFRLVNEERAQFGLGAVSRNAQLEAQASAYACEMIQFDFFAHENPVTGTTLRERTDEFGYDYAVVGENLAAGQTTPLQAFNDWLASPSHRENILDERFTELGVGIMTGGSFGTYWVQEFGRPADEAP